MIFLLLRATVITTIFFPIRLLLDANNDSTYKLEVYYIPYVIKEKKK